MNNFTHFIKETLRSHTREELTLSVTRSGYGTPWLYLRVVLLIAFTVMPWVLYLVFSGYSREFEPVILSSLVFIIGYCILTYELAPGSDFKLWQLLLLGAIGGVAAIFLVVVIADIFDFLVTEDWHSALRAGIGEELYKLLVSVLIIKIFKKKKPVDGLLVGLFVGAGFAFFENVMYIYRCSDLSDFVSTFIERNANAIFTHMFWTGLTAYAFNKLSHPLKNFRFYLIVLLAMALHSAWDLPTFTWLPAFLQAGDFCDTTVWEWILVIIDLIIAVLVFISWFKARKRILLERQAEENNDITDGNTDGITDGNSIDDAIDAPEPLTVKTSFFAVAMAFTFSAFLCIFAMLHSTQSTQTVITHREDLGPYEEYILKAQNGLVLPVDLERPFNEHPTDTNARETYEHGVLTQVTQWEEVPGGFMEYSYQRSEETGKMELYLSSICYVTQETDEDGNTSYLYTSPKYALRPGLFPTGLSHIVDSRRPFFDFNLLPMFEYGTDYVIFFDLRDFDHCDSWKYEDFILTDGRVFGVENTTIRTIGDFETVDWIVFGACAFCLLTELALLIIEKNRQKKRTSD